MAQKTSTTAPASQDTHSATGALPPAQVEEVVDSVGIRLRRVLVENWIVGVLFLLIVVFTAMSPAFFSQANWLNVSQTAVYMCLLAVTQTLLVIAGAIDLSQGAIMGLSGVIAGSVISNFLGGAESSQGAWGIALAFVIALAAGALCGLVNGLIIAISRLNPFIVTLGTYQAYTGLANLVSNGQDITNLPPQISRIGNTNLFGWVSIPVLVAVVIFLILAVMLRKTRFGKYIYVIGDSEEAAVRAGIKVKRHMVILFTLSGTVSAVAGVLEMTRLSDASPSAGSGATAGLDRRHDYRRHQSGRRSWLDRQDHRRRADHLDPLDRPRDLERPAVLAAGRDRCRHRPRRFHRREGQRVQRMAPPYVRPPIRDPTRRQRSGNATHKEREEQEVNDEVEIQAT